MRVTTAQRGPGARPAAFVLAGLGGGAVFGVLWWLIVALPRYQILADRSAVTSERSLTEFIAGDAWFAVLGLVYGIGLGVAGWRLFRSLGWPLVVLVVGTSAAAALLCWTVGWELGPGQFAPRLAAARPGDEVPIELTLRTPVSLLVWPFFAIVPVLFGSALGHDEEDDSEAPWAGLSARWTRRPRWWPSRGRTG